jgi:hypothetical protein
MGWMPLPANRFTALVAMLAVFGAHAACVCHMAAAAGVVAKHAQASGGKASHACCSHAKQDTPDSQPRPKKTPAEGGGCRHCSGLVTAAARPADSAVGAPSFQAPALAVALIETAPPSPPAAHPIPVGETPPPYSTSLLRLHCALNL